MAARANSLRTLTALGGRPPGPGTCPPMSPKILIVEDDSQIRSAVTRALTALGCTVASAGTAMAGLQLGMSEHPDVVVLDLGIPGPARGRPPAPGTFAASTSTVFASCAGGQVTLTGRILQSGNSTARYHRGPARTASVTFSSGRRGGHLEDPGACR
jgi:CheY-like chemotaxis protein